MHACLELDGARFHLNDEFVENDVRSPLALGGTPVTIHLGVADCDTAYDRAVAAGCVPFGHQWSIATPGDSLSPEAMEQAIADHVTANVP